MKYLALGDSYTIGENVKAPERWPHLLVDRLNRAGYQFDLPKIIATTGWTTDELINTTEKENPATDYDLVSLLIGVNNQYRGYPLAAFKVEFEALLHMALKFANDDQKHVFVVAIPDYSATPFGKKKDPQKISSELNQYNAFTSAICHANSIPFVDISAASREALNKPDLIAADDLHPSAKMYALWLDLIFPIVKNMLE